MALLSLGNKRLVLASASPRRKEILNKLGIPFLVRHAFVAEEQVLAAPGNLDDKLKQISLLKAKAVVRPKENSFIIGADTVVVCADKILGKPKDKLDAGKMLLSLSGRSHQVKTGIAVLDTLTDTSFTEVVTTEVFFKKMSQAEIDWYLTDDEALDKAGAYGIQEKAGIFIEKIAGCYYNVVGLPISRVYEILTALNSKEGAV
ncbi:MAG: Maf family protein [Candidatus Margulisiibacteriota bacterium]|jgi:septum formation protein